jgi:hypothetical protein
MDTGLRAVPQLDPGPVLGDCRGVLDQRELDPAGTAEGEQAFPADLLRVAFLSPLGSSSTKPLRPAAQS